MLLLLGRANHAMAVISNHPGNPFFATKWPRRYKYPLWKYELPFRTNVIGRVLVASEK